VFTLPFSLIVFQLVNTECCTNPISGVFYKARHNLHEKDTLFQRCVKCDLVQQGIGGDMLLSKLGTMQVIEKVLVASFGCTIQLLMACSNTKPSPL